MRAERSPARLIDDMTTQIEERIQYLAGPESNRALLAMESGIPPPGRGG